LDYNRWTLRAGNGESERDDQTEQSELAVHLSAPAGVDSRDANDFGDIGEFCFDFDLIGGDFQLLGLHFFDQRQKCLLILLPRRLCARGRDNRKHAGEENGSDESFHGKSLASLIG
jgi:hypothetical protein